MTQQTAVSVAAVLKAIIEIEGAGFFHEFAYCANWDDADRRRVETARRLAHASEIARSVYFTKLKLWCAGAQTCPACNYALTEIRHCRAVGADLLHLSCAEAHERGYAEWNSRVEITDAGRAALENAPDAA